MIGPQYVLHDGPDWWYCFPRLAHNYGAAAFESGAVRLVDTGDDMDLDPVMAAYGDSYRPNGWFHHDRLAGPLTLVIRKPAAVTSWIRKDMPLAATVPPVLTAAEMQAALDEDSSSYVPRIREFYEPVRGEPYDEVTPIEGPFIRLDASLPPPVPKGAVWSATLPTELRERVEYLGLFPGKLTGFHEAVAVAVTGQTSKQGFRMFREPVQIRPDRGKLAVTVLTSWDPPRTVTETRPGDRKPKVYPARPYEHHFDIVVPDVVEGRDLASAAAEWDARMADVRARVEEAKVLQACSHCHGRGFTTNP